MVKKLLLAIAAVLVMSGSFTLTAPSASAAIERCSGPVKVNIGITLESCISVDPDNARAYARLLFDSNAPDTPLDVWVTIHRSGNTKETYCFIPFFRSDGLQDRFCNNYATNPAGTQSWQSDSVAEYTAGAGGSVSSPVIFDT